MTGRSISVRRCFPVLAGILFSMVFSSCTAQTEERVDGMTFVASINEIEQNAFDPLLELKANWTAIIPYGFLYDTDSDSISYNHPRQWWGERTDGARKSIQLAQSAGLRVMLKPQIWIGSGAYTGNVTHDSEEHWKKLEDSYRAYILEFAQIAADENVALFCIGTEWDKFIQARPQFWSALIDEVRAIYSGKLTYAANWDEYKRIPFWDQLDYIGVDAYFPLSDEASPSLETLQAGWQPWLAEITAVSARTNTPVLFTEWGYVSTDYAGKEPWKNMGRDYKVNNELQSRLYQAMINTAGKQEWYAGGFVWKYHHDPSRRGFERRFTPQDKLAWDTLRQWFLQR